MDNRFHEKLIVSSAPHAVGPVSTRKIMSMVLVALIPAFAVGIYQFGYRAATLTIVCVVACVVFEYLMNVIIEEKADRWRYECGAHRSAAWPSIFRQDCLTG